MKKRIAMMTVAVVMVCAMAQAEAPLALHPKNGHYLVFRGKPTVLITSGEHYGAVLNMEFDFIKYLDALAKDGLNLTRTFSGTYREIPDSFGITDNTLSPKAGAFACPWARTDQGGAVDGGNKFDLTKFDGKYFERLKTFIKEAGARGIVVEYVFYCTLYNDKLWEINPMHAGNNINDVGVIPRKEVFSLKHKTLLMHQEAFVKKVVAELKDFDNVYYEICNEPYIETVADDWQAHIAKTIVDTEKTLGVKHLIAQNIANGRKKVEKVPAGISILNFHYATPPDAVEMNFQHNIVIGDDETGFKGREDVHYRTEGWDFLMAGGAIYSHLDYSFTPKTPDGTLLDFKSPGGGGPAIRRSLGQLRKFMEGFDLVAMKPMNEVVKGGQVMAPVGQTKTAAAMGAQFTARVLGESGKQYAIYLRGGRQADLVLDLPAGKYKCDWVNTRTGEIEATQTRTLAGGKVEFKSPGYEEDVALRIVSLK